MKVEEHSSLWSAIQQFPLDDPNAAITFSHKLAAKQNWTPFFTERVITEYRKFLFLCCISPTGASPSQAVDEAWHLHLTYTKSYWIDLCKNTLQKDIHHHPSRGGDEEDHKHRDWYAETLLLYQSVFGSPPPDDIWPPPPEHSPQLPEPEWRIRNEVLAVVVMLLILPLIISAYLHKELSPFSLNGPQFLVFLPLLAVGCLIGYILLQYEKKDGLEQLVTDNFPTNATIFETSLFLFGKHRVIQTAIIDLIRRQLLEVARDHLFTLHRSRYYRTNNEQNPLIGGFLNDERLAVSYTDIADGWFNEETVRHPALQKLYLLAYYKEPFFKKFHVMLIPYAVIILRFLQGMYNGKPVSYLMFELLALVVASGVAGAVMSRRSIMIRRAKTLVKDFPDAGVPHNDNLVASYARGENSIEGFADGFILAAIFAPYPILRHNEKSASGGSCSSCSGGGCSGGGGGCGGGCGGCGGGCGS